MRPAATQESRASRSRRANTVDAAGVETWRNLDGSVAAISFRRAAKHCLAVSGIGMFELAPTADQIRVVPEASASPAQIEDALHRIAVPLGLQLGGRQVLHASAVLLDGVVALCGRAGAGKSTIAYELSQRGCPLWGDDAVAFEPSPHGVHANPLPFRVRLRATSAAWFGEPSHQKGCDLATPWRIGSAGPLPFRALFLLERLAASTADEAVEIGRLAPADAFAAVLPHAYFLTLENAELNRRLLDAYLTLAEELPVFVLRYVPRLSVLGGIADAVKTTVAQL